MTLIPSPETLDPHYAGLLSRKAQLEARATELRATAADLRQRIALALPSDDRRERVDALLAGQTVQASPTLNDEIDAALSQLRDVQDALLELGPRLRTAHILACRKVAATFGDEHRRVLSAFWKGTAAAAKARCEIEGIHRAFRRAGVLFDGIHERGEEALYGVVSDRTTKLALGLRNAARDGLISASDIPEALR